MQTSKKQINYQLIAILMIGASLVAGIWIFGFDDELFGTKTIKDTPLMQNPVTQQVQKTITQDSSLIESKLAENTPKTEIKSTQKQDEQSKRPTYLPTTNKNSVQTNSLENTSFVLDVDGTAYEGAPSLTKPAEITLKLNPVRGTNLEKFDVLDGKILIGTTVIPFHIGTAEIKGTTITISVIKDDQLDPYFSITGTIDKPISASKNSNVSFANQLIQFGKHDETTPYHFDVSGEITKQKP